MLLLLVGSFMMNSVGRYVLRIPVVCLATLFFCTWNGVLRATIATLKANPQRSPVDPDSKVYGEEVRMLLHGKRRSVYRVLFTIRRDTVHVLTVRHSA